MNKEISILQALLDDTKGNAYVGNPRKMAGYLNSMSNLAGAMSRQCSQQFEIGAAEELEESTDESRMKVKKQIAQRELELAELETKLATFAADASSGCFLSKEDAAKSLRVIADTIEAEDTELFPKPWTEADYKAYAESIGATYSTAENVEELLASVRAKAKAAVKPMKAHARGRR